MFKCSTNIKLLVMMLEGYYFIKRFKTWDLSPIPIHIFQELIDSLPPKENAWILYN